MIGEFQRLWGLEHFGVSKGTVGGPIKMRKPSVVGYGYFLEFPNTAILIYMGMSPIGHIPAKPLNPPPTTNYQGYRMVPFNLKVLTKFGLCSNCSQKLDVCSLVRTRKSFASTRMLGFSLKFPVV